MLIKTENLWKLVGCFWTWQNGVLGVCFFWGFNIENVCFWCVWHCLKSVKNVCFFPSFWAFLGWLIVVHLGLEGLGVFVFHVFALLLCVAFVSVLFALLLVLLLDCFGCWFFFYCVFVFFVFFGGGVCFFCFVCFVGGFKGQVRWPERPPHLALNPLYLLFLFFLVFCLLVFLYLFVFCFCFLGRVSGSGEVAQRATSLAPKPSLFVSFCFFWGGGCFLFFAFNREIVFFP